VRLRERFGVGTIVVLASAASLVAACTQSQGTAEGDPLARLESLGTTWRRTPATVTYSTIERHAGDATSIHQCLRRMLETVVATAIRACSGEGELALTWDPPDHWRMEVSNAQGSSVLVSTPDGAYRCHRSDTGRRRCEQTSAGELESNAPFGAIFLRPTQILQDVGREAADSLATRPDREIAGIRAECFSATLSGQDGDSRRAEWCFSKDGVLLSSLVELTEEGTSRLEAIDVQRGVSDTAFEAVPRDPDA
jgi:hypothetical protein